MAEEPDVIRQQIDQTRSSLTEKLETLEQEVRGTVESAKATVEETIQNVKSTVQETVHTVKRTFDLNYQVDRHPWAMVGGSAVAGFLVGNLVLGRRGRFVRSFQTPSFAPARPSARETYSPPPPGLQGDGRRQGVAAGSVAGQAAGWMESLLHQFEPELHQVKELAIGAALGLVRDVVKQAAPQIAPHVDEIMNSVTAKLGGKPIREPMFQPESAGSSSPYSGARRAL